MIKVYYFWNPYMPAAGSIAERSWSQINAEAQAVRILLGLLPTACYDVEAAKKLTARAKEQLLEQKQQMHQQQQQEQEQQCDMMGAPAAAVGGSAHAATGAAGTHEPLVGKYGRYLKPANFFLEVMAPEFKRRKFPHLAPVLQRLTDMSNGVVSGTWWLSILLKWSCCCCSGTRRWWCSSFHVP